MDSKNPREFQSVNKMYQSFYDTIDDIRRQQEYHGNYGVAVTELGSEMSTWLGSNCVGEFRVYYRGNTSAYEFEHESDLYNFVLTFEDYVI